MDTATAKELLQSDDIPKLRQAVNSLQNYETNSSAEEEQILKLQLLIWNRVLQLSTNASDSEKAEIFVSCGNVWMRMGENERASGQLQKALALQKSAGDCIATVKTLQLLGQAAVNSSDYETATEYHQKAIAELVNNNEQQSELALAYTQLASVFEAQSEFATALQWIDKAADIYDKISSDKEDEIVAVVEAQRGTLQEKLGEYEQAVVSLSKAHDALMRTRGEDHPRTQEISFLLEMARSLVD